jgi:hypothetical protein
MCQMLKYSMLPLDLFLVSVPFAYDLFISEEVE